MAVLATLFVVVAVNCFLYFGYYSPAVTPPPTTKSTPLAEEGKSPSTAPESTGGREEEGQRLRETTDEAAVPSRGAATTASPGASPSASPP